jgi:chromosome segregation ATPase
MRTLSKIFAAGLLTMAMACGGSSDSAPGPLSKHFDDMWISSVPTDQKQSVVQTQSDYSTAKMENANAESHYNEFATQLSVARNEQKAAHLGVDSAKSQKKAADQSADNNRMNQATKDLHTAESLAKAADARVKYFEAYLDFLKRYWRFAQETMYWREAQYENAKSSIAQKNNKQPKGVNYNDFPKQEQDRGGRAQKAKSKVDDAQRKAVSARQTWQSQQQQADTDNGHPSNLADPMAAPMAGSPTGM